MNEERAKLVTTSVLKVLNDRGVSLNKVLLHKFIYFLNAQDFLTGIKFEPYTYGPYSFDLASVLRSLAFWGKVKEDRAKISIVDLEHEDLMSEEDFGKIQKSFDVFSEIVGSFSFNNLECFGTTLYCAKALAIQGQAVDADSVYTEFRAWKGDRYNEETVKSTFAKIRPYVLTA